jgi:hypothetical protein
LSAPRQPPPKAPRQQEAQQQEQKQAQHGGTEGHLPPRQENVKVVGRAEARGIAEGRIADVNFFGDYAYLAAFREPECRRGGVYVFSIRNLAEPRQVGFIEAAEGTYVGEGVQIIHVDTPQYEGDVLIHNNEICDTDAVNFNGGVTMVDVSNPREPKYLAEGVGDLEPQSLVGPGIAHQVHSAFAWDAGRRAYAVLVDGHEEGEDVDIMNITNPREPRLIAEYDLNERFPQIIQEDLGTAGSSSHDMIVKNINGRWVMLLSYWDGGYVLLDVTDPRNPTYIADSDFKNPDPEALQSGYSVKPEGNAHTAEFSLKNNFIVATDEDEFPYSIKQRNVTDDVEFDGWGYVHLFKNGEGKLRELDTYAIPEAHNPRFAEGFGDLSVHEVAMSKERNDLAYFSYFAGGFRVAKIQGGKLVEIGSYIAPKGNNFWGVQVLRRDGKEYVLASDRDYGLYIFRYTGRR